MSLRRSGVSVRSQRALELIAFAALVACTGCTEVRDIHRTPAAGAGGSGGEGGGGAGGSAGTVEPDAGTSAGSGGTTATPEPDAGDGGQDAGGGLDPNITGMQIFLLFGQSNMEGTPAPTDDDRVEDPRVQVLAYDNCGNLGRTYNQWYAAVPPLHSCGLGLGPGDQFGKMMARALPNATIGLVPNAISGVDIDFYRKGVVSSRRSQFRIPPDNAWTSAYDFMLERARLAQESGTIRGILFHQGESDTGQQIWLSKVRGIVEDLRNDLGIGEVPFLAGELLYSSEGGCCSSHNTLVNRVPDEITNAFAISAEGLGGMDQYHFDLDGQRELGQRYARTMLQALGVPVPE